MAKYSWVKESVPQNLVIKQVYGIVFSNEGNILLRVENNKYKLTGGKPEKYDKDFEETLKREYIEELSIETSQNNLDNFNKDIQKRKNYREQISRLNALVK